MQHEQQGQNLPMQPQASSGETQSSTELLQVQAEVKEVKGGGGGKGLLIVLAIFALLVLGGGGAAAYYFLVVKPGESKQEQEGEDEDVDEVEEGEHGEVEEIEEEESEEESFTVKEWSIYKGLLGYEFKYPSDWTVDTTTAWKSEDPMPTGEDEKIVVTNASGYKFIVNLMYEIYLYRQACYFEGAQMPKLGEDPPAPYYKIGNFSYYYDNLITLEDHKVIDDEGKEIIRGFVTEWTSYYYGEVSYDENTYVLCEMATDGFYVYAYDGFLVSYVTPTPVPDENVLEVMDEMAKSIKKGSNYIGP